MLSDLSKHPDTEKLSKNMGMIGIFSANSIEDARRFIEGFIE